MIYVQLGRFLLPLVLTAVVQGFSAQVLNGGMARMPQATQTLASYGLAWGLVSFLASPLLQVKQLGLVLVNSRHAFRTVQVFVVTSGLLLTTVVAVISAEPVSIWVIEELHGVSQTLAPTVRLTLRWLIPFPFFRAMSFYYMGLLIRFRRTDIVSYAILSSIVASILMVFTVTSTNFVKSQPIRLPLMVTYVAVLVELIIVFGGYRYLVSPKLDKDPDSLSLAYVARFFWPLALIMVIQGLSRPLINLFISREFDGARALAVLTVVYPLAHMLYGWVNEIRNLPPAFAGERERLGPILRFAVACGLLSFALMVTLFWTPLQKYVVGNLIGADAGLTARARIPLMIATFLPLAVMLRAYIHGVGLLEHRTRAMAPSAPFRIAAVLATLMVSPAVGLHGATRGIAALLSGFILETITVWWGVLGRPLRRIVSSWAKG